MTIKLARLISVALPHQFLIGSYIRELGKNDQSVREVAEISRIDTPSFMVFAAKNTRLLHETAIGEARIERANTYLTGDRLSDNEFTICKFDITDSHDRSIRVGLFTTDLAQFDACHVKNEDIRLKMLASG